MCVLLSPESFGPLSVEKKTFVPRMTLWREFAYSSHAPVIDSEAPLLYESARSR